MAARRGSRTLWCLSLLLGAILFWACAMLVYESAREYLPRFDLPAFDASKAAGLSDAERARDELELFNELSQWKGQSRQYAGKSSGKNREHRWRKMSDEGFELAHVTLQVLQPERGLIHPLNAPMKRLDELAERGDTGAMCLMTELVDQAKRKATQADQAQARRWLQEGVERQHPQCQLQMGRRLLLGIDGYPQDMKRGVRLELAARRAGYVGELDGLLSYFQRRWSKSRIDLTRLYCWLSIDAQSRLTDSPQRMLAALRAEARRDDSAELTALARELDGKKFTVQACADLGAD